MASSTPRWLESDRQRLYWHKPWLVPTNTRKAAQFKKLLREHGYLSPHFKITEAACHDAARTPVPQSLLPRAQRHAFNLERLRHELGDVPLSFLSWYRTPEHNRAVGGASDSRHMKADGTDIDVATVNDFGARRFDLACEKVFDQGGFGRYPSGSRHVDSRGERARW